MKTQWTRLLFATAVVAILVGCIGCAAMPKVKVGYYDATATLTLVVTQTATCNKSDTPVLTADLTPTISFSANTSKSHTLNISTLGSALGNADVAFEFYPDGRLKGINSKGTGQSVEIVKAVTKAAAAISAVGGVSQKEACKKVREIAGDGKPLTIVRRAVTDFSDNDGKAVTFGQVSLSKPNYSGVADIFGELTIQYKTLQSAALHGGTKTGTGDQTLQLVEPAPVEVTTILSRVGSDDLVWSVVVPVPQKGTAYELPILSAPWFGSNEMEVQLQESGRLTKLKYAGAVDSAGALNALAEATSPFQNQTMSAADKAKAVQGEADLIYQQQRLVLCQADPNTCPK